MVEDREITPDFTVVFQGPYELVGEVKRALGGTDEAFEPRFAQLAKYDRPLQLRVADGGAYQHNTSDHDIVLLINIEHAARESKKLSERLTTERAKGAFGRAVCVFSVGYDNCGGPGFLVGVEG